MSGTEILQAVIEILVGGIVPTAQGIGEGLSTLVQSIFLQTTGDVGAETTELSVFATIVLVFAGVSLSLGLGRWVLNLITSLGARNR